MLGPENRTLLFESLRPDVGYELDHAVITTFTLDLTALLAVPLAITFHSWEGEEGETPHPLAVLDAVRSSADRVTIVGQAGAIAVPRAQRNVYALVEDSVRSVGAPNGGAFHPKVWVLRFTPTNPGDPVTYRLVVASRNLTFDRSWDLALLLDGVVGDAEGSINRPLRDFVAGVAALVNGSDRPLDSERAAKLEEIEDELGHVSWMAPDGLELIGFHEIGLSEAESELLATVAAPTLIISPFLGSQFLAARGATEGDGSVLISRQEELDLVEPSVREQFSSIFVLSGLIDDLQVSEGQADDGEASPTATREEPIGLRGLHAKLFITDRGWRSHLLVGSANATSAAFTQNVEFMVELTGSKSRIGIASLVGDEGRLRALLDPYRPNEEPDDEGEKRLAERAADGAVRDLAFSGARLVARQSDGDDWSLRLVGDWTGVGDGSVEMRVWPVTLNEGRAKDLGADPIEWTGLGATQLSAFLAVAAVAHHGSARVEKRAAVLLRLEGAPQDRASRIVREILESPERLMRYLALLLSDLDSDPAAGDRLLAQLTEAEHGDTEEWGGYDFPVFEGLMRALDRDPSKIDRVASLLADLTRIDGETDVVPEGFEEVWAPIAAARERMGRGSK